MPINPSSKRCWSACPSCMKCSKKGAPGHGNNPGCASCSGRHDPLERWDPFDRDVYCDCKNGILRHRLQTGRLIIRKFLSNPFGGSVVTDAVNKDEEQWNQFIAEKREQLNDETWDPITIDGKSAQEWTRKYREGSL